MTNLEVGQKWMTKSSSTGKIVGYEVTGVGREFVSFQPLGHTNTHYLTHEAFYAMFDFIGGGEGNDQNNH